MQAVLAPHGKSQMGNVETFFITGDGDDVTIVYCIPKQTRVADCRLGNIAHLETCECLFLLANQWH